MYVSRCMGSKVDCSLVQRYEVVEYDKDLPTLVHSFDGHPLSEPGPSVVVSRRLFIHMYFSECFNFLGA